MKHSDLLPGDVVFPMPEDAPWVVIARDEERMLYLANGRLGLRSVVDCAFNPSVLIVRGGEAINGGFP